MVATLGHFEPHPLPACLRKTRTQNSLSCVLRWFHVRTIMHLDITFNSLATIVVTASDKRWGEKAGVLGQSDHPDLEATP